MPKRLDLVLCWHMHQPDYRDYATGEFVLPWVYLHAIKDYADMAAHLERHPGVRAVVNFVPVLLDQIDDYAHQFRTGEFKDPLLRLLAAPDLDALTREQRAQVFRSCFHANQARMIDPYPPYRRLQALHRAALEAADGGADYLSGQYCADLITWYHLVWLGESVRRENPLPLALMKQAGGFTREQRTALLRLMGEVIAGLIPRYRALAERGQIELSTTPYYHPLAPLLLDFRAAREAERDAVLPKALAYPGGEARVRRHLEAGIESHRSRFGAVPGGVWPAEGAVSRRLLELLAQQGCGWVASGEGVLRNSLCVAHAPSAGDAPYRPYRLDGLPAAPVCFFRDDRLSDLIGFEYARWHGKDAAHHFIGQLEAILGAAGAEPPLVSVILDGENAWEHYPFNGYYFFTELYSALEAHPLIRTRSFSGYLEARRKEAGPWAREGSLHRLVAGSWVYGNFSTWIGAPDKNRAWDLLCDAKSAFDAAEHGLGPAEREAAERQLASLESSDWFWWFGDYNSAESVASFDSLFRAGLKNLYGLLKWPPPAALYEPVSRGGGQPEGGGAMRRAS